ncbi:MAG: PepSY domain-containing protein [Caulobacteraceae bacterium]|nr:PepSY domain-containing protein [Caulobacteraceae bacterium]
MTGTTTTKGAASAAPTPLSAAYRTVWRWHFWAGLISLPFLMLMALTGAIYLFKPEIDDWQTRGVAAIAAPPAATATLPSAWTRAALAEVPGRVASVLVPARADRAVRVTVEATDGSQRAVFVDPANARVTGHVPAEGLTDTVKKIHSLILFGPGLNIVVEIVAGWAIILVATGIFLWWPRPREAGVVTVRARAGRPLWRDIHAVTGLYAGAAIVFLAVTGMPWSAVWGDQVMGAARQAGFGRPAAPVASEWVHAEHTDAPLGVGWSLEHAGMTAPAAPIALDRVLASVEASGLPRPYAVTLPASPDRAVTAAFQNTRSEDARVLYLDRSGTPLRDVTATDFGTGARAFEWGIAVHQGTQYGQINRWIMLLACVAVWVLSVSALMMWWKRRPKGRLAAPVAPPGPRAKVAVLAIVLPLAILYPLTGLSLVVAVVLDRIVARVRRPASIAPV